MLFFSLLSALTVSVSCFATEFSDPRFEDGKKDYEPVQFLVTSGKPITTVIPAFGSDYLIVQFTLNFGKISWTGSKKFYLETKAGSKSKKFDIGKAFHINVNRIGDQNPYQISCTQG